MAKSKQSSRKKLLGSDIHDLPEGPKSDILGSCADLKEPSRSKCIDQHSRAFKEGFDKKRQSKISKKRQRGDV